MWPNPQISAYLVTFTEEILNGKLHVLCSVLTDIKHFPFSKSMDPPLVFSWIELLRKAIMTRSKLENSCNLGRTSINFENYKKQRNICVNLLRKSKKQYFNNIDVKNVMGNKKFWRTIRPKLSKKCKTTKRIILV